MKVFIEKDEWWPVYGYEKPNKRAYANPDYLVEVPDELLERYDAALKAFEAVHVELSKYGRTK